MCLSYGFHILITLEPYKVEKVLHTFEKQNMKYRDAQSPSLRSDQSW